MNRNQAEILIADCVVPMARAKRFQIMQENSLTKAVHDASVPLLHDILELYSKTNDGIPVWKKKGVTIPYENMLGLVCGLF